MVSPLPEEVGCADAVVDGLEDGFAVPEGELVGVDVGVGVGPVEDALSHTAARVYDAIFADICGAGSNTVNWKLAVAFGAKEFAK